MGVGGRASTVFDRGDAQPAKPSTGFGNLHPPHRRRPVGLPVQLLSQRAQPRCFHLRIGGQLLDGDPIHTRRSRVCFHTPPGCGQHVGALHFSIQTPEPIFRFGLRFPIQRDLQLANFIGCCRARPPADLPSPLLLLGPCGPSPRPLLRFTSAEQVASLRSSVGSPNQRSGTGSSLLRTPPTPAVARTASPVAGVVPPVESSLLAMTGLPAYPRFTSRHVAHADPAGPLSFPATVGLGIDSAAFAQFRGARLPEASFRGSSMWFICSLRPVGSTPCLLSTPPHGDAVGTVFGAEPSNCTDGTLTRVEARFTGAPRFLV